jgi:hypothetical protein
MKPTPEEQQRAREKKHSLMSTLQRLDIYSKFKVIIEIQGKTVVAGLKEAIVDYINKYKE